MKKVLIGLLSLCSSVVFSVVFAQEMRSITDARDGEVYKTVKIGDQVWMAENLRYNAEGSWLNPEHPSKVYGRLYDWATVMGLDSKYNDEEYKQEVGEHQGICPAGWHVPSDEEWKALERHLGMSEEEVNKAGWDRGTDQGLQLKSASGWADYEGKSGNGNNSSGFNAFPAGFYSYDSFLGLGKFAYFWSSTAESSSDAWCRNLYNNDGYLSRYDYDKKNGHSCRCLKN